MSVQINKDITTVQVEVPKTNVAIENAVTQITVQTSTPQITISQVGLPGRDGVDGVGGGAGEGFPYSGSAVITGSLLVSGSTSFTIIGDSQFSGSLDVTGSIFLNGVDIASAVAGTSGTSGTSGISGSSGTSGISGSAGTSGTSGTSGVNGSSGTSGVSGSSGTSGVSGSSGTSGISGSSGFSIDSGSYATTGSNIFNGNQTIIGSVTSSRVLTDAVRFNTSAGVSVGVGELAWNNTDGTLDLGMKGGNVVQQIGQEIFYEVRNETGIQIPNGTAVYAIRYSN